MPQRKATRLDGRPDHEKFLILARRISNADAAAHKLREVAVLLKDAPQTRRRVLSAIKSADGAVRHAERMFRDFNREVARG